MTSTKTFAVDARTVLMLGRQSIKDHITAVLELVKNSYDADATSVRVEVFVDLAEPYVRVADNGIGMTPDQVDDNWLRIGFSAKAAQPRSNRDRRKTGEKGIGRISADRLGAVLELRTQARGGEPHGLRISWDLFDVPGTDISDVPIDVLELPKISLPDAFQGQVSSGTELIITELRQVWSGADIRRLHEELSVFSPPFDRVEDFQVELHNDVDSALSGVVESPFYSSAEIELRASLENQSCKYSLVDRSNGTALSIEGELDWAELVQRVGDGASTGRETGLGNVGVTLMFYPRKASILAGTDLRLSDLREFLDRNAGVKIYRDRIRVRPYGDPDSPEGDWLGLAERRTREPAGVSRPTYKVAANQIVGAVFIGRDSNVALKDSASREGMIRGESFYDLRAFVLGVLTLLEAHRHETYLARKAVPEEEPNPVEEIEGLQDELGKLLKDLTSVRKDLSTESGGREVERARDQVVVVEGQIRRVGDSLEKLMNEAGVLRGLATIGIATSVFGHETQSALSQFVASTYAAQAMLRKLPQDLDAVEAELGKAIAYAKRVTAWGNFSLLRVRRDKRKRRKQRIDRLVEGVLSSLSPVLEGAGVRVETELAPISARVFSMDVESVVVNLLTNAYMACQAQKRRVIVVELGEESVDGRDGFNLSVSDSGTGVAEDLREKIFQPLFTTRRDEEGRDIGTGLGLAIVDSVVRDMDGRRSVDESALGGARFRFWFPQR